MRLLTLISIFLVFWVILVPMIATTDGKRERQLHVTSLTIQFDKEDAMFDVNYDLDKLSEMYIIVIGGKSVEPKLRRTFSNFDYDIIKMDQNRAILKVKNISRLDKGYYLHDPHKFGDTIDIVYIYSPGSSRAKEYFNTDSTPYYFYR